MGNSSSKKALGCNENKAKADEQHASVQDVYSSTADPKQTITAATIDRTKPSDQAVGSDLTASRPLSISNDKLVDDKPLLTDRFIEDSSANSPPQWTPLDAINIVSNPISDPFPGVIIQIDASRREMMTRFWNLQSLEIRQEVIPMDSDQIQRRHFESALDPWSMPMDDQDLTEEQQDRFQRLMLECSHSAKAG